MFVEQTTLADQLCYKETKQIYYVKQKDDSFLII